MSEPASKLTEKDLDSEILAEIQLVLAEKRTSLSALRTGIAIFAFPLSVLSVLVATSKSYHVSDVLHLMIMIIIINVGLVALAIYLIVRSLRRIRHYDRVIDEYKQTYSRLGRLLGE
jgi:uncharacterized membrane protein YidH (DUF202 family)